MDDDAYVAISAAARLTGISERTLRYWVDSDKLPAVERQGTRLVRLGDVRQRQAIRGKGAGQSRQPEDTAGTADDLPGSEVLPAASGNLPAMLAEIVRQSAAEGIDPLRQDIAGIAEYLAVTLQEKDATIKEQAEEVGRLRGEANWLAEELGTLRERAKRAEAREAELDRTRRPWWRRILGP